MKLMHLSDLHLGKRLYETSLLADQEYILDRILEILDLEQPEAVLISGDVYDKAVPSAEAVILFDSFLNRLADRKKKVLIISGNHDSSERLAFGSRLMEGSGVHFSPLYNGTVSPITLDDDFGPVDFFLLPFVKPSHVRRFWPEETIESYTDAIRVAVSHMDINPEHRSVLLLHQFITGAGRCDSELQMAGGLDNVDASVLDPFDYVALGHIHGPQSISRETIRYCGTPLKYSLSEVDHEKSVTIVELQAKGETAVRTAPLHPLRDLRILRGTYLELTDRRFYETIHTTDFFQFVLTDEDSVPDAYSKLRLIYPNGISLRYENIRETTESTLEALDLDSGRSNLELCRDFYFAQNGTELNDEQLAYCTQLIQEIWEDEE